MTARKLETRTKIQLGGLIIKSGLSDILNISPGDDLQLDYSHIDKAHTLLGILKEVKEKIEAKNSSLTYYTLKGKSISNE